MRHRDQLARFIEPNFRRSSNQCLRRNRSYRQHRPTLPQSLPQTKLLAHRRCARRPARPACCQCDAVAIRLRHAAADDRRQSRRVLRRRAAGRSRRRHHRRLALRHAVRRRVRCACWVALFPRGLRRYRDGFGYRCQGRFVGTWLRRSWGYRRWFRIFAHRQRRELGACALGPIGNADVCHKQ